MLESITNKWVVRYSKKTSVKSRLFCFPYAGGSAGMYKNWIQHFEETEIVAIQLPGRSNRFSEACIDNLDTCVFEVLNSLKCLLDKPFAFFGHSLGAIIAYEVLRKIPEKQHRNCLQLFVSGRIAPDLNSPNPKISHLPNDQFKKVLKQYEGTDIELLKNNDLMDVLIPMLRSDFKMIETYDHHHNTPLKTSITALSGKDDLFVDYDAVSEWQRFSEKPLAHHSFDGNHFFVDKNRAEIGQLVSNIMLKSRMT